MSSSLSAYTSNCPRCGERSLERFSTHTYCACCNYSNVTDEPYQIPEHVRILTEEVQQERKLKKKAKKKESEEVLFANAI